ncbi:MAG: aminotransferase class III-fold pyridoxal phosphate-dependent enzyme, partial [Candidatus Izemoplasmatales bacterium]|nr:aminotransferase class III-fold pyridoxal phosphate-dependent enzyme [Candidatus Izemoplasmatales bacterium]
DIVSCAKGLGGGLPIGAVLCSEKLANVMSSGTHGSTFGGNPICSAAALHVLERVSVEGFLDEVTKKGEYIKAKLLELFGTDIKEIRGRGLMFGIDLAGDFTPIEFAKAAIKNGLLPLTAKSAVRLLPPLTISYEEIDKGLAAFGKALEGLKKVKQEAI